MDKNTVKCYKIFFSDIFRFIVKNRKTIGIEKIRIKEIKIGLSILIYFFYILKSLYF